MGLNLAGGHVTSNNIWLLDHIELEQNEKYSIFTVKLLSRAA